MSYESMIVQTQCSIPLELKVMSTEITPDCSFLLHSLHAVLIGKGKIKLMQQM